MDLYVWSCFFLASTSVLCMVGLVLPGYRDNLLQCTGMFVLMIGCASRVAQIWERGSVPPDWFMVHAGIGIFAYGVLMKVLTVRRRRRQRAELHDSVGHETYQELSAWHSVATARDTDSGLAPARPNSRSR